MQAGEVSREIEHLLSSTFYIITFGVCDFRRLMVFYLFYFNTDFQSKGQDAIVKKDTDYLLWM